ncbi:hypothetical protein PC111_g10983 [Phytophthora cactorum]|uniref:Uncharacterized protein n=1 Tax=Phytophthora cactorum TaxID=29920 RepID=A0A8T1DAA0_9STRA|nr:hypothetical protein PC111_g10983 [Phytophthora cactorum]KAG2912479.1 hypothetical protein PC114_g8903 [Phytophthora cactorum]KAG2936900.1 hypothetical protein PC117_g11917 [Phytophthora cactorum]
MLASLVRASRSCTALTLRRGAFVSWPECGSLNPGRESCTVAVYSNQYDYRIENDEEEEGFFVEQLQKHRRFAAKETKYDLLHVIPATSSVVERFFSVARTTFGKERHGLLPITLEIILFLRENGTYWDEQTADEATRS